MKGGGLNETISNIIEREDYDGLVYVLNFIIDHLYSNLRTPDEKIAFLTDFQKLNEPDFNYRDAEKHQNDAHSLSLQYKLLPFTFFNIYFRAFLFISRIWIIYFFIVI